MSNQPIFINAQEMAKSSPTTFEAPTKPELDSIRAGDFVKICHSFPEQPIKLSSQSSPTINSERFWLTVVSCDADGTIIGTVGNDLINNKFFDYGSTVTCNRENIYQILKK
ncbi:hypothetical protein [Photobacterium damselae]|uniref:hypothetical protein n=1 Tax=Photobacterium damselae TaxID=38293 RepID=UPI001F3127FA|nr:hypothetical protein [Photobacterium damselae]UKA04990.1 hypothetical protein IHC89_22350 [Photobacterium damselae subsp. damselae]